MFGYCKSDLLSFASPSHSFELIAIGLLHVLVLVDVQEELQVDSSDQMDHPPVRTQSGFLEGFVQVGTQSWYISDSPAHGLPPFVAAGLLQYRT